jgi:hypothetical protein
MSAGDLRQEVLGTVSLSIGTAYARRRLSEAAATATPPHDLGAIGAPDWKSSYRLRQVSRKSLDRIFASVVSSQPSPRHDRRLSVSFLRTRPRMVVDRSAFGLVSPHKATDDVRVTPAHRLNGGSGINHSVDAGTDILMA